MSTIRCLHLPKQIPFPFAQAIQAHLVRQFLNHKAAPSISPNFAPPTPIILSFTPRPIYTFGRREKTLHTLTADQLELLRKPLDPLTAIPRWNLPKDKHDGQAEIVETLRGGQTTFHGPGQIVIYPIFDIKTSFPTFPKGLTTRCYVNLLEEATIRTLNHFKILGVRTENPGVWDINGEKKIAALGVRLRRNVSSFGVGFNINTDLQWFDRIVACGLEGKRVTSLHDLGADMGYWRRDTTQVFQDKKAKEQLNPEFKRLGLGNERFSQQKEPLSAGCSVMTLEESKDIGVAESHDRSQSALRKPMTPTLVMKHWRGHFFRLLHGANSYAVITKVGLGDIGLPDHVLDLLLSSESRWTAAANWLKANQDEDVYR